MKRIILSTAGAVALAALAFGTASAQYVPPGSYQQSCSNIHVRGNMLIANCNAPRGGTVRSTIPVDSCRRGDIANMNGQLTCNGNSGYGRGGYGNNGNNGYGNNGNNGYGNNGYGGNGYAPGGSYQGSCINIQSRGGMLSASCTAPNGQRISSSINAARCRGGDIANVNGYLRCR